MGRKNVKKKVARRTVKRPSKSRVPKNASSRTRKGSSKAPSSSRATSARLPRKRHTSKPKNKRTAPLTRLARPKSFTLRNTNIEIRRARVTVKPVKRSVKAYKSILVQGIAKVQKKAKKIDSKNAYNRQIYVKLVTAKGKNEHDWTTVRMSVRGDESPDDLAKKLQGEISRLANQYKGSTWRVSSIAQTSAQRVGKYKKKVSKRKKPNKNSSISALR